MTKFVLVFLAFALGIFALRFFFFRSRKNEKGVCVVCDLEMANPVLDDGLAFCGEHAHLYRNGDWPLLAKGRATPNDPEYGVRVYEFKQSLANKGVRSYIRASYAQENEEIVTYMELRVLKEDLEKARALSRSWEKI